ncbi:MAG: dTDP-4-dehydrorhamnose reductase [Thermoanaerobaculia bacterium]
MSEAAVAAVDLAPEVLAAPRPAAQLRRRVLVTGASGMFGTDLVPALAGAGCEVFARPKSDLDITRPEAVARAFRDTRPEVVVNCAAFTKVDACESDPRAFEVNAGGVELLAAQCLVHSSQLVQISTDFVFDGSKGAPYAEEDATAPLSAYGRSKLAGERAALRVPTGLVVRASWLFGRGGWNFAEAIRRQIEDGRRELTVVDDQRGRPTATTDLAEALLALLELSAVGVYHFANRGEVSWFELAREIVALSGRPDVEVVPIDSGTLGRPARRPSYSVLDTGKYEKVTGRAIRHFRDPLSEYLSSGETPAA